MAKETITIPDAKADPTYQQQVTELARQKVDFGAQQKLAGQQYGAEFKQQARKLGRSVNGKSWDRTIPNGQFGQAYNANEGDFAGRGMIHSGLYAKQQSNLYGDFNNRYSDLQRGQTDFNSTAALSARNFAGTQEAVRQQGLAAAVAAIAAKYGINSDQVPKGKTTKVTREGL